MSVSQLLTLMLISCVDFRTWIPSVSEYNIDLDLQQCLAAVQYSYPKKIALYFVPFLMLCEICPNR